MAAKTDNSSTKVTLSNDVKALFTAKAKTESGKLAKTVSQKLGEALVAQLALGRYLGPIAAKMTDSGARKDAVWNFIAEEVAKSSGTAYSANYIETWSRGAVGYDSLTVAQRKAFRSMDVFVKLGQIEESKEGEETRQQFTSRLINAGITSESEVRKAVVAENNRRKGKTDNELSKVRNQTAKVATLANKDVTRLSKTLVTGNHAKLFLIGAAYMAGICTTLKGMDVKAYRDGVAEAFHPLTLQPNPGDAKPEPEKAAKPAPKAAAKAAK